MSDSSHGPQYDFGVLLPGVGVFGGVRRFIEIGNELVRRGHRFTIYHPDGAAPTWLPFAGRTRRLDEIETSLHDVLMCNDPPLLPAFRSAHAALKLFYFALEKIRGEASIARSGEWVVLSNSSGMHDRLLKRYRVNSERVIGGINLDIFRPDDEPSPRQDDTFRVLAFGRVSRRAKGTPIVIRAAERLAQRRATDRPVKLVLFDHVGPGNETSPREQIRCAIPHELHLNLSQEKLAALYRSCDVFVSAERKAGWANTVAEAMACGVPVVCTRSGTRDIALPDRTARVVNIRHDRFLAHGISHLYDNPDRARTLAESAREHIAQFSWSRVTDQLLDVVGRRLG